MNKLLQYMIGAGNVSDKFLPHLAKAQKGFTALPTQKINPSFRGQPCYECGGMYNQSNQPFYKYQGGEYDLPEAQFGLSGFLNPVDMGMMASRVMNFFGMNKPKIVRTPASAPKRLSIRDPRKIMMTTGKPLRPNSDLVSGEYDSEQLGNLLTEAKRRNMSYNDMMNLAAMGFQETKWGKSDDNIGHTKGDFGPEQDSYSSFINAYNTKMKDADRLKIKDEATRLQVYNGLGKIFPSTEANYHGFKMKKIYGVEVPKGGIDLRKNPLYGKQVIDIRDNVLKRNPEFMRYMDSTYRASMPEEEFANGGPILDPRGQWAHPGKVTRIPGSDITMQGVNYPVYGVGSNGQEQMMYPGQEYDFDGASYVDEYPMMQRGGTAYIDSVLNANKDLNWVQRLYQKNPQTIQIPGQKGTSTHFMESGDGRVYPTVVQIPNGQLQYLGDKARDYADSTKTYIQFPTDKQATRFGKMYKKGTGVLSGFKSGGQHGGLDRWFAEKWVDVKTGKACGRQEGEKRAGYPACRPSKRVNSQTPKTSSEMSSAEKAKFKASKTSSQRINYNHKRNK